MFGFGVRARRDDLAIVPRPARNKRNGHATRARSARRWLTAAAIVGVGAAAVVAGTTNPAAAAIVPTVPLATAAQYSVLGGQTVTNTGPSVLGQSAGVSPGAAIVGFPPGLLLPPSVFHAADAEAAQAQLDLTAAYDNAAGRPINATTTVDLGGLTLVGGVYESASNGPLALTGTLTLDGSNDPNSVFIFKTGSDLTTASTSSVSLINGAQACNVFWQVGASATIGTGTAFVGNILALTSISVTTGATVQGRALARNGSVTLDNNVFTAPSCDLTPLPAPTTTPAATTPGATTPAATSIPGETIPSGAAPPSTDVVAGGGPTFPGGSGGPGGAFPALPSTGDNSLTGGLAAAATLALGIAALLVARRRPSAG